MRQPATLKLDSGEVMRVEVSSEHLARDEFVVRRIDDAPRPTVDLLAAVDAHLASVKPHPAGTTDRLLGIDRDGR